VRSRGGPLPAGSYRISSAVETKAEVTLRGEGMGATMIAGAPGFSDGNLLEIETPGDSVTDGVVWDPEIEERQLPASLYLPGRPEFWGSQPWPASGPDPGDPEVLRDGMIPAQERYRGG
jgi:hypothetical protein